MSELLTALTRIRQATEPLPVPPGVEQFWSTDPEVALRPYQIQMVWNFILCPSFLCGDSPGLGKCLAKDSSLIWGDTGLFYAKDLLCGFPKKEPPVGGLFPLNFLAITDGVPELASEYYNDGLQETAIITTERGDRKSTRLNSSH